MWPFYFIYQRKYQQTYNILGCFDTGKLSESGFRNGSETVIATADNSPTAQNGFKAPCWGQHT
jgi:hypothetical protein